MNIAFFGTSDRSIPVLQALKNSDFNLVLCVTKEDVRVGRKQELKPTAVKTWAEENGVQFVTAESLNAQTTSHIATLLSKLNIELAVVADFSFIIPEKIINTPRLGIVNIHFSLLPRYRGASPVQHAILNMDEKTGITYQLVARKMDAGDILHQTVYEMTGDETSGKLYSTLFEIAGGEISEILESYASGKIVPQKQDETQTTYTYSPSHRKNTFIYKEDAKIDWSDSPEKIYAAIRAYNPWPIAWTTFGEFKKHAGVFDGVETKIVPEIAPENEAAQETRKRFNEKRVKIYEAELIEVEGDEHKIRPLKIQIEGKSVQDWDSFRHGYIENM